MSFLMVIIIFPENWSTVLFFSEITNRRVFSLKEFLFLFSSKAVLHEEGLKRYFLIEDPGLVSIKKESNVSIIWCLNRNINSFLFVSWLSLSNVFFWIYFWIDAANKLLSVLIKKRIFCNVEEGYKHLNSFINYHIINLNCSVFFKKFIYSYNNNHTKLVQNRL